MNDAGSWLCSGSGVGVGQAWALLKTVKPDLGRGVWEKSWELSDAKAPKTRAQGPALQSENTEMGLDEISQGRWGGQKRPR
jgi:hypothetical protein